MMRYVAIIQVTDSCTLGLDPEQLKRVSRFVYKSPSQETKVQAEKWLETTKKAYPERYFVIKDCIICFEDAEKEKVESMLSSLIQMF